MGLGVRESKRTAGKWWLFGIDDEKSVTHVWTEYLRLCDLGETTGPLLPSEAALEDAERTLYLRAIVRQVGGKYAGTRYLTMYSGNSGTWLAWVERADIPPGSGRHGKGTEDARGRRSPL